MSTPARQLASGDTVSADLLRDFLATALRHDAIRDVLIDRVVAAIEGLHSIDRLRFRRLGSELPGLIADVIDAADPADWQAVAERLIEESRETMDEGGDPA